MKKTTTTVKLMKQISIFFALILTQSLTAADIIIKDSDISTSTYSWTKNNTYILDGFVFLEKGGVLNIEAGTVIKGKSKPTTGDNASALIIAVGGKINAIGTQAEPIIFTAEIDDMNDKKDLTFKDRGLWGGLIILGDGKLGNKTPTANIEGIPTTETRAKFGGSNNANNAGTLKYVSIRHGGVELAPGDEINGLTLGGVGSGTTLDYIEVYANKDDGIEFFGGAVDIKHASVSYCGDDGFDWDLGWKGNGQFWFVLAGTDVADNGGEWDGAKPDGNVIYSSPTVYNATFIGSGSKGVTAKNSTGILMRDATAGIFANSIITDYAKHAIEIEDLKASKGIDSYKKMEDGELKLLNNIWYGFGSYTTFDANAATGVIRPSKDAEDKTCAKLIAHLNTNKNTMANPMIKSISRNMDGNLDPRINAGSPAFSNLAAKPSSSFFDNVNYKGAFGTSNNWLKNWTALATYGHTTSVKTFVNSNIFKVYPNPANNILNITLNTKNAVKSSIQILTIDGKIVKEDTLNKISSNINVSNLNKGLYIIKLQTNKGIHTQKLIIQ